MHYVDSVVQKLGDVVGGFVERRAPGGSSQTVTISRPREEVEQFWRDPEKLTAVLDGSVEVRQQGPGEYVWIPTGGSGDDGPWHATLFEEGESFRFAAVHDTSDGGSETAPELVLTFRDAPRGLGTEVTMRTESPLPKIVSNLVAFALLYRARALMQTGEVPTLRGTPSARGTTQ